MANRGRRGSYSGQRPQGNGYYQGAGGRPDRNGRRKKRRRLKIIKSAVAWIVCILLAAAIGGGAVCAASSMDFSKKKQLRHEGIEKLESGDYEGAVTDFDFALEKSGKKSISFNSDVLMYRAEAEFKLKDYKAALHTYGLLLKMEPDTPSYLYAQSMCYSRLKEADQAVSAYQSGTALEKKGKAGAGKLEALVEAGNALVEAAEYDKAISFYQDGLKEGMGNGELYNQMGICQLEKEDYKAALASFEKGYDAIVTGYQLGAGTGPAKAVASIPGENGTDLGLLKELTYNKAVACEYLHDYKKALNLFQEYVSAFGSSDDAEHEIAFLKTR